MIMDELKEKIEKKYWISTLSYRWKVMVNKGNVFVLIKNDYKWC